MEVQRLRVESTPAGAEVSSITGRLGVTPLTVSERDIYPNTFPDEDIDLYGTLVIRKAGCKTVTHRVTLEDIGRGIGIRLECAQAAVPSAQPARDRTPPPEPAAEPPPRPVVTQSPVTTAGTLSERRLRQLKVVDELLEDGLISIDEERTIRKRILDSLEP
jgi:hypothetical protein